MVERLIQLFLAAIFCLSASSMLLCRPQYPVKETRPSGGAEVSFGNVERKYSSGKCSISAANTHNSSGFLLSLLFWEVEETDDEKEISDFQSDQGTLPGANDVTAFVDPLRQSNHVTSVPLFIVLHSWKHFLS